MGKLTVAIDDAVLKRARVRAFGLGTSVNALVRDYLADLAAEGEAVEACIRLRELLEGSGAGGDESLSWSRTELYEARLKWPR